MKGLIACCMGIGTLVLAGVAHTQTSSSDESAPLQDATTDSAVELKLETLLSTELEAVENTEVIVSRVTIPPNTSLPKHWHPGEEFAFVLEGSAALWMDGKADTPARKGDVLKVPLRQVHTAVTGSEGATLLVFRIHEKGKPERIPVD